MDDQEVTEYLTSLENRMNRLETLMQELLLTLTSSQAHIEQTIRMRAMLEDLRRGLDINPATVSPQEQAELDAIYQAVRVGNKIHAIKLYRNLYGVGLREAKNAIDAM